MANTQVILFALLAFTVVFTTLRTLPTLSTRNPHSSWSLSQLEAGRPLKVQPSGFLTREPPPLLP